MFVKITLSLVNIFLGIVCENNPKSCKYISWNKPKLGEKWDESQLKDIKKPQKNTP